MTDEYLKDVAKAFTCLLIALAGLFMLLFWTQNGNPLLFVVGFVMMVGGAVKIAQEVRKEFE